MKEQKLKELLEQIHGIIEASVDFNEVNLDFEDDSHISFKAEGYEGTKLKVCATVIKAIENEFEI